MNKNAPGFVIGFVIVLSVVFGAGVAAVHYATLDMLARNDSLHYNKVLARAFLLDAETLPTGQLQALIDSTLQPDTLRGDSGSAVAVVRNRRSGDIGLVFSGVGFWDKIEGILVLNASIDTVRHIQFLVQSETPGLGARIEEHWFTEQFRGVPIGWSQSPDQRLVVGQSLTPGATNRVDAITGATQTSMALMRSLNHDLARLRAVWNPDTTGGSNG